MCKVCIQSGSKMESCATKLIEFSRCLDELFNKIRWNKVETHTNVVSIGKKKLMRVSKLKIRHTGKLLHVVEKKWNLKDTNICRFFHRLKCWCAVSRLVFNSSLNFIHFCSCSTSPQISKVKLEPKYFVWNNESSRKWEQRNDLLNAAF